MKIPITVYEKINDLSDIPIEDAELSNINGELYAVYVLYASK